MIDTKTQNIINLSDIKEVMVKTMLNKYSNKELSNAEIKKFYKYLDLQQKNNTSKNSVDSRIESLYKLIQKNYNDFTKLNEIITQLD